MLNIEKFNSYQAAFKLLNAAVSSQDLPLCIAAIALTESIIADRCLSFLTYKEANYIGIKKDKKKHISTNELVTRSGRHFIKFKIEIKRKQGPIFKSDDLFLDVSNWLKKRNFLIHGFAKSEPGCPTISFGDFLQRAIEAAKDGLKYASLVKKWHQSTMRNKKL